MFKENKASDAENACNHATWLYSSISYLRLLITIISSHIKISGIIHKTAIARHDVSSTFLCLARMSISWTGVDNWDGWICQKFGSEASRDCWTRGLLWCGKNWKLWSEPRKMGCITWSGLHWQLRYWQHRFYFRSCLPPQLVSQSRINLFQLVPKSGSSSSSICRSLSLFSFKKMQRKQQKNMHLSLFPYWFC